MDPDDSSKHSYFLKIMGSLPGAEPRSTEDTTEEQHMCEPCKKQGDVADGLNFCLDCMEVLCETCTTYHNNFKVFKHHRLITARRDSVSTDASRCNKEVFTNFTKCEKHAEREVGFYCEAHDVVMCSKCATTVHKACHTQEIPCSDADSTQMGEKYEKLVSGMRAAVAHVNVLQKFKVDNKNSLRKKTKEIREYTEQARDQVKQVMEKTVNHVTNVTKQLQLECENSIDDDIERMRKIKDEAENKLGLLDAIEKHGSERHKFVAAHFLHRQFKRVEEQLFEEDGCLISIDAELKLSDDIKTLTNCTDVDELASVTIKKDKSCHRPLDYISNVLKDSQLVKIDEHSVRLTTKCAPKYHGIAMNRDRRVILIDSCDWKGSCCGFLCLYNPANRNMLKLKLNRPYSAAQIDDTHFAVSIPNDKVICIVIDDGSDELKVEKSFYTKKSPASIVSLRNGNLAISWARPAAFSVVDISGPELVEKFSLDRDSSGRVFRTIHYFAVDERRQHVIQSCFETQTVYCFTFTGDPVFSYRDSGFQMPHGVALDRCGNVYVCMCSKPGRIYKLSPGGELIRTFCRDVPISPLAICGDGMGTGFWVTQDHSRETIVYLQLNRN